MSDYISSDKNNSMFFNSVYGNDNCPWSGRYTGQLRNTVSLIDKDVGFNVQGNQYEALRRCYPQRKLLGSESVNNDSEDVESSYVQELQRLSSNLIRLLREASDRTIKVKASCGASQRPQHEQRLKHQGVSGILRSQRAEKHSNDQLNSSLYHVIPEQGSPLPHPGDSVVLGVESTASTSCQTKTAPDCVLSPADKTYSTSEVLRNGFPDPSIDASSGDTHKEKDRKKKETHNKIEKRRRSLINDRITELGKLLPEHIDRAACQKKGSILKSSIDYIKMPRRDQDRINQLESKMIETYDEVKKLANRLEELELRITNNHANSGGTDQLLDNTPWTTNTISCSMNKQQYVQTWQEPPQMDILTTVSDVLAFDEGLDDLSATLSVDSTKSLFQNARMDVDVMEYYL